MMNKYIIIVNGLQKGPFSIDELKSQAISGSTLVWNDGLENWTEARNVEALAIVLKTEAMSDYQNNNPVPVPPPVPVLHLYLYKVHKGKQSSSISSRHKKADLVQPVLYWRYSAYFCAGCRV
jgi:hypothetical protein